MLSLTRRPGECIVINNEILITLVKTKGNQVTLGFDAHDKYNIVRLELVGDDAADILCQRIAHRNYKKRIPVIKNGNK